MDEQRAQAGAGRWPKIRPELTAEQHRIMEDWYQHWLKEMPDKYGWVDRFGHEYPLRDAVPAGASLEIGAGLGGHLGYEPEAARTGYVALEMREDLAEAMRKAHPWAKVLVGDCERRIDFPDGAFDRALAIHVLEHLGNLPAALEEIRRVLKPEGRFYVVIPCEGGLGYSLGRALTTARKFRKRYKVDYEWMISYDHLSRPAEILEELEARFSIVHRTYFPLRVPSVDLNLVIGLTCVPRPRPAEA